MNDNVVPFTGLTTVDLNPDAMMAGLKGSLKTLLWMGRDENGQFMAGCSTGDTGEALVMLELAKKIIMEGVE